MNVIRNPLLALFLLLTPGLFAIAPEAPSPAYAAVAQTYIDGANTRDADLLASKFRFDLIADEALKDAPFDSGFKAGFKQGFTNNADQMGNRMLASIPEGNAATLIRWREFGNGYNALVRIAGDGGVAYSDLFIRPIGKKGKLAITDVYTLATGEKLTDSVRNMALFAAPQPSVLNRLLGQAPGSSEAADQFLELIEAYRAQDFDKFTKLYIEADKSVRAQKLVAIIAYNVGSFNTGDNTLTLAALNDIKQYHGDDPGMSLMLIDYYILNEQYEDAIKAVERLEKYSGTPDAVLLSMRGNILLMNGDADAAIAVAREGIQAEPGEDDPYWTLADAQARSGEYASAVATFKQLESLFGYEFDYDYYRSQPDYEAFAKSPAFERWAAGE